jgi:hypothetical protein
MIAMGLNEFARHWQSCDGISLNGGESTDPGVDWVSDPDIDNDEECGRCFEDPSDALYDEEED